MKDNLFKLLVDPAAAEQLIKPHSSCAKKPFFNCMLRRKI